MASGTAVEAVLKNLRWKHFKPIWIEMKPDSPERRAPFEISTIVDMTPPPQLDRYMAIAVGGGGFKTRLKQKDMETATQTSELVQLVENSGLEESKQNQIAETLGVFFNKASEWDATIQSIVITSPEETGKMKMAREGRLTLKNMRLDADKLVKGKRDEVKYKMANYVLEDKLWLKAGQMIEATFKNLETKLEEKERFAEIWAANLRAKLKAEREAELEPFAEFVPYGLDLGIMSDEDYAKTLKGAKLQMQDKIKAEEDRIAKEKAEAAERERIRKENERLKQEAEAKEKELAAEREKAEAERKAIEAKARKEREEMEAKAAKLKAEADAKLKAERDANEKLQAQIKAKAEAESRAQKEAEAKAAAELKAKQDAEAKAAKAPKKQKLKGWIDGIEIGVPVGMAEDKTVIEIREKFDAFKKWAKGKIEIL